MSRYERTHREIWKVLFFNNIEWTDARRMHAYYINMSVGYGYIRMATLCLSPPFLLKLLNPSVIFQLSDSNTFQLWSCVRTYFARRRYPIYMAKIPCCSNDWLRFNLIVAFADLLHVDQPVLHGAGAARLHDKLCRLLHVLHRWRHRPRADVAGRLLRGGTSYKFLVIK